MIPPPLFSRLGVLLPLAGMAAALAALPACRDAASPAAGGPPPAAPPARVLLATAEARDFPETVEALGTVRAREAIVVSSTVTDRVEEVFFEDGDTVQQGDLLVRLSDAEERAMLAAAEAEAAEQAREIERLTSLAADGAVSQVRLEETETRRDIAAQRVEEARARLADRSIVAPFDGALGFRQVSPGALVSPGDPITTLDALDPARLDFAVPETFLDDLRPGLPVVALSAAYPEEDFLGEVTQIDTRVDPVTRSVTVRAEIPNPGHRLRPGMLMTTDLARSPRRNPAVPERALVTIQTRHFVFTVDESASEPAATRVEVTPGRRLPGYVEILEGISEGQRVVSDGLVGLQDGAMVAVSGEFPGPSEPYRP